MERTKCPHCGHPSPPPSPGVGVEEGRKSPAAFLSSFDPVLPSVALEAEVLEPRVTSEVYRPLWDLFGLATLTVASLLLYFFLSPGGFPWFTVVSGFWILAWTLFHFFRYLSNEALSCEQKRDGYFDLHARFSMAASIMCLIIWLFVKPWHKPWFIFVFAGAAALLTLHYSLAFLDWKRLWLYPQLQLYLNTCITCFLANSFFSEHFEGAWWLWPCLIWGALILIQLLIFFMITRRRIRLTELDPESQRQGTNINSPTRSHDDFPLLSDFNRDFNKPLSPHPHRKGPITRSNMKRSPSADSTHRTTPNSSLHPPNNHKTHTGYEMPTPIPRKNAPHHLSTPVPFNPALIGMSSVTTGDVRTMDIDLAGHFGPIVDVDETIEPGSTPLVEHVATSSDVSHTTRKFGNHFKTGSKYAKGAGTVSRFPTEQITSNRNATSSSNATFTTTTDRDVARPIAMRVIHQDESTVDVIEASSLAASDGVYIDVVRIPDRGFG